MGGIKPHLRFEYCPEAGGSSGFGSGSAPPLPFIFSSGSGPDPARPRSATTAFVWPGCAWSRTRAAAAADCPRSGAVQKVSGGGEGKKEQAQGWGGQVARRRGKCLGAGTEEGQVARGQTAGEWGQATKNM